MKKCYYGTDEVIKVGQLVEIVSSSGGNHIGAITKVTQLHGKGKHHVCCEAVNMNGNYNEQCETKIPSWFECIEFIRPASKGQRERYYEMKRARIAERI